MTGTRSLTRPRGCGRWSRGVSRHGVWAPRTPSRCASTRRASSGSTTKNTPSPRPWARPCAGCGTAPRTRARTRRGTTVTSVSASIDAWTSASTARCVASPRPFLRARSRPPLPFRTPCCPRARSSRAVASAFGRPRCATCCRRRLDATLSSRRSSDRTRKGPRRGTRAKTAMRSRCCGRRRKSCAFQR